MRCCCSTKPPREGRDEKEKENNHCEEVGKEGTANWLSPSKGTCLHRTQHHVGEMAPERRQKTRPVMCCLVICPNISRPLSLMMYRRVCRSREVSPSNACWSSVNMKHCWARIYRPSRGQSNRSCSPQYCQMHCFTTHLYMGAILIITEPHLVHPHSC